MLKTCWKANNMTNPIISENGDKIWYNTQGQLHREEGPAIERFDGRKEWRINGLLHREDGPAAEWDYSTCWFINGKQIK
jgi:hypothetical protein